MTINYELNRHLTADEFFDFLKRLSLAERRPVAGRETMLGMAENSNLVVTAWDNEILVGVARSMPVICLI
jgi:hypothetical protein